MVATHSGSMAGSYLAFSALVRQSGLIEVLDFDAFWELARLFAKWGTTSSEAQSGVYGKLGAFAISGGDAAFHR